MSAARPVRQALAALGVLGVLTALAVQQGREDKAGLADRVADVDPQGRQEVAGRRVR